MENNFLKPIMLWSNVALAVYALVVYYKPEIAESISTEMILGVAAAFNSILLGYDKIKEA